jgi:hypothetical protein
MNNKKEKQVLFGGLVPVGGGRMWEEVWEDECGGNIMYTCM